MPVVECLWWMPWRGVSHGRRRATSDRMGPSLVTDENGAHFGLGFTPWVGVYTIPFYTGTVIFGDSPNIHQLGMNLKLHINTDGDFGTHDDWDD